MPVDVGFRHEAPLQGRLDRRGPETSVLQIVEARERGQVLGGAAGLGGRARLGDEFRGTAGRVW